MRLIRIGQLHVNVDRLAYVEDLSAVGTAGQAVPGPLRLNFGEGRPIEIHSLAPALRAWLAANSEAVIPAT